jgi:hypothetical protein
MSYSRFGIDSDTYIYEHAGGFIECCGCGLPPAEGNEVLGLTRLNTAREALEHAQKHLDAGHMVPDRLFTRIREEYPDLDSQILPYVTDPVEAIARKARMKELYNAPDPELTAGVDRSYFAGKLKGRMEERERLLTLVKNAIAICKAMDISGESGYDVAEKVLSGVILPQVDNTILSGEGMEKHLDELW